MVSMCPRKYISAITLAMALTASNAVNAQVYYRIKAGDTVSTGFFSSTNVNNIIQGINSSGTGLTLNSSLISLDSRYLTTGVTQAAVTTTQALPSAGAVLELTSSGVNTISAFSGGSAGQVIHVVNIGPSGTIRIPNGTINSVRGGANIVLGPNQGCTVVVLNPGSKYSIW